MSNRCIIPKLILIYLVIVIIPSKPRPLHTPTPLTLLYPILTTLHSHLIIIWFFFHNFYHSHFHSSLSNFGNIFFSYSRFHFAFSQLTLTFCLFSFTSYTAVFISIIFQTFPSPTIMYLSKSSA